jgi:hypothetical protein
LTKGARGWGRVAHVIDDPPKRVGLQTLALRPPFLRFRHGYDRGGHATGREETHRRLQYVCMCDAGVSLLSGRTMHTTHNIRPDANRSTFQNHMRLCSFASAARWRGGRPVLRRHPGTYTRVLWLHRQVSEGHHPSHYHICVCVQVLGGHRFTACSRSFSRPCMLVSNHPGPPPAASCRATSSPPTSLWTSACS